MSLQMMNAGGGNVVELIRHQYIAHIAILLQGLLQNSGTPLGTQQMYAYRDHLAYQRSGLKGHLDEGCRVLAAVVVDVLVRVEQRHEFLGK